MFTTRIKMAVFAVLCCGLNAQAQFDDSYDVEEWTLDDEEVARAEFCRLADLGRRLICLPAYLFQCILLYLDQFHPCCPPCMSNAEGV